MKAFFKRELMHWLILLVPFTYLIIVYPSLPHIVPIHYNADGAPDSYDTKGFLMRVILALTLGAYLFLLIISIADHLHPSYAPGLIDAVRMFFTVLCSAASVLIIYTTPATHVKMGSILSEIIVALSFSLFGKFMASNAAKFSIGTSSSWFFLKDPVIVQKTYRLLGRILFVGFDDDDDDIYSITLFNNNYLNNCTNCSCTCYNTLFLHNVQKTTSKEPMNHTPLSILVGSTV